MMSNLYEDGVVDKQTMRKFDKTYLQKYMNFHHKKYKP